MKPLFFIIRKSLKNLIKGILKKPLVLIGYIFALLFVVLMVFMAFFMPSELIQSAPPELFRGIVTLVFTFMYFTYLKVGLDKGSTYFRMADVNLAFTSPIKPNRIMLYAFIKQIGATILFLFIAICQIPNLKNNFAMHSYGAAVILLAAVLFALAYPLINMAIYSWVTKKEQRKKRVKWVFNVLAIFVVVFALINLGSTGDIGKTISAVFDNPIAHYFPVIGWTASIANAAVTGFTMEFWVGAVLMTILIAGGSVAIYRMNLDYYEDVLKGTEYVEAAVKAKREGNNLRFNLKVKDNVKQKITGKGAAALFYKNLAELRKTAIFLFFDRSSITVIVSSIIFKFVMSETIDEASTMLTILVFSLYIQLIMQVQVKLNSELDKHYVFLIPESSQKKLLYGTLAVHVKNLIDGFILFVISGILFKASVPVIIACALTYTLFGAVYVYTDVLSLRLFGGVHSKGLLLFIKIIVHILIFIPGIIAAVLTGAFTESTLFAICALGGWSLVLAITFFMLSSGIFNNLESAG